MNRLLGLRGILQDSWQRITQQHILEHSSGSL
jgi:hypothetical protein